MEGDELPYNVERISMLDESIDLNTMDLDYYPKWLSSIQESENDMTYNDNYQSKQNHMRSSPSIKEEDLMALSKDSEKNSEQIEKEINNLLKRKGTNSEAYISHQKEVTYDNDKKQLQELFENWLRENLVLGENFIIVWLDEHNDPINFYERAKNNLFIEQKFADKIITEELFMDEVIRQADKEFEIKQ